MLCLIYISNVSLNYSIWFNYKVKFHSFQIYRILIWKLYKVQIFRRFSIDLISLSTGIWQQISKTRMEMFMINFVSYRNLFAISRSKIPSYGRKLRKSKKLIGYQDYLKLAVKKIIEIIVNLALEFILKFFLPSQTIERWPFRLPGWWIFTPLNSFW